MPIGTRARPDTFYGVGKAAAEALCSLYHDRHGIAVACLRIGSFRDRPTTRRHLATWLSPGDAVRLVDACLGAPDLGFASVYGISANRRAWWDLASGRALGYDPQDDAEQWAAAIEAVAADGGGRARRPLRGRQLHPPALTPQGPRDGAARARSLECGGTWPARPGALAAPAVGPDGRSPRSRRDRAARPPPRRRRPPGRPGARRAAARPGVVFAVAALPSAVTFAWLLAAYPDVVDGGVRTRARRVDPRARRRPRPPPRRLRRPDAAPRRRHRRPRRRLRVALLQPPDARRRAPRRAPRAVRRGDGRPRPRRRPARAVRVLGAHVDDVVPAHRQPAHDDATARAAALQALLVTGFGALAMLAGFIVLGQAAGTYQLSRRSSPTRRRGTAVTVAIVLILLGAFTKSAQVPFHSWLPGRDGRADAGEHLPPLGDDGEGRRLPRRPARARLRRPRPLAAARRHVVGVATMVLGGLRALRQHDLKLLLAYGTVSQLGFMVAVFGWGTPAALIGGVRDAPRPRRVQGRRVHGRRHPRPPARHARPPQAAAPDPAAGRRPWSWPRSPPRRWPASRCCSASSPRRPTSRRSSTRAGRRRPRSPAWSSGRPSRSPTACASSPGPSVASPTRRSPRPRAPPATARPTVGSSPPASRSPSSPSCSASCRPSPTTSSPPAARALDAATAEAHLEIWHGINIELLLSGVALAAGAVLYVGRRRVGSVLAYGSFVPPSSGRLPRCAARRQRRRPTASPRSRSPARSRSTSA